MKRCFIIGNGPSLNDIDLTLLKGEITFGTNRIYLSGFQPKYYVCVNPLVLEQFGEEIAEKVRADTMFIPGRLVEHVPSDNIVPIDTTEKAPSFQKESKEPMWEGHTVTYVAMQLAYQLGFREIVLIGVDHYYGDAAEGRANQKVLSTSEDTAHFHPDYFGPGTKWHLPDLQMSEIAYSLAKAAFEDDGGCITNATAKTRLRTFPLETFPRIISRRNYKVSAIISAYYAEEYLQGCIDDLKTQTLFQKGQLELIFVAQLDSPEDKILTENFGEDSEHCAIHLTPGVPTVYEAWNKGIRLAAGEYITNANTDDRRAPIAYEIMASVLDANEHIDLVYHNSFITWEQMSYTEFLETHQSGQLAYGRLPGRPGIYQWPDYDKAILQQGCYIGPHPMWRATLHQRYGMFGDYKSAGDYEFWLRIAREDNFFHIPKPLGLYHASEDGIELSDAELSREETFQAIQSHADPSGMRLERWGNKSARIQIGNAYTIASIEGVQSLLSEFVEAVVHRVDIDRVKTEQGGTLS